MKKNSFFTKARDWYAHFERPISSLSLVGGFVFDALTLRREDIFLDNAWIVTHLIIVTSCAIWINLLENEGGKERDPHRLHFWLVNIMQFFFGGILSTYLVFYFRSGTFATSWPFLFILAAAFVVNESFKHRYARITFQIALLFLSYYAFAIYLVPILIHKIGVIPFFISGAVSLATIGIIIFIIAIFSREHFWSGNGLRVFGVIAIIFIAVNTLYFSNLIPPLPLSLENAGIYHSFTVNGPGNYTATGEPDNGGFFSPEETAHILSGGSLWAYTSIFSPMALRTDIIHEWQYYSAAKKMWITRGRIPLSVVSSGNGDYRTFSEEFNITPGQWRVDVETPTGAVIGRISFNVITVSRKPALKTVAIR